MLNADDSKVFITGFGQAKYERNPDSMLQTQDKLTEATKIALKQAGISLSEVDGLGVSSFTLHPDRAIDIAVKFGIKASWIMDGGTGGASGIDMAQHAMRAIQSGDAKNILLVSGDVFQNQDFTKLVSHYNKNTEEFLLPMGIKGPNSIFALITKLQMEKEGFSKKDYGRLVCMQRMHASKNENAAYRKTMDLSEYLEAPEISSPLGLFDCVPVVAGANAIILSAENNPSGKSIVIRRIANLHNWDLHEGDGTVTGLAEITKNLWSGLNFNSSEINYLSLYDDYPAIVLAQLIDLGYLEGKNKSEALEKFISNSKPFLNLSGGQLSAGQCGAGAGMHGFIEVMNALQPGEKALITGYGMVVNRYGACSNVAILEAL